MQLLNIFLRALPLAATALALPAVNTPKPKTDHNPANKDFNTLTPPSLALLQTLPSLSPPTNAAEYDASMSAFKAAVAGTQLEVFFDTNHTISNTPLALFFDWPVVAAVPKSVGTNTNQSPPASDPNSTPSSTLNTSRSRVCNTSSASPLSVDVVQAANYLARIGRDDEFANNCRMDLDTVCTRYTTWGSASVDACSWPKKFHMNCEIPGGHVMGIAWNCAAYLGGQWRAGGEVTGLADLGNALFPLKIRVLHS